MRSSENHDSNSSSTLIDPEVRSVDAASEYGGIVSRLLPEMSHTPNEEIDRASMVMKSDRAKFNPNCVFESEAWEEGGVAGIGDEISNLLKNIVGSGGLSIPGGIAVFANSPGAIWPSIALIWIMGVVNAYSFSLLGRICEITKSYSYSMAWERTVGRRYGSKYQLFVDIVVFGKAILGTWSFSIMIQSTCTPLVYYVLASSDDEFSADSLKYGSPTAVLITITLFVLLPLCLSQRLASLSIFSAIGTIGTSVTITTMTMRYFDGTYEESGKFYKDLSLDQRPSFGTDHGANAFFASSKSLTLVSILSTGFVAHYNAPKYYYELRDRTTGKFNIIVNFGFFFAAVTYTIVSALGFLTFGENCKGFILDNYSYRDPLATIARFGIAVSVISAYPLLFHGGRDGFVALLQTLSSDSRIGNSVDSVDARTSLPTRTESNTVTVALLSAVTALAIYFNDLTFVLSFSGATMSSLIIYIFPPFMFSALVKNCCCYSTRETEREVKLGYVMMVVGAALGTSGAYVSIQQAFF
mmetsp:Transcript_23162/g.54766  ORF Transcript_23162/g.54766 Transcript_23162/m.54766 type:complete len:526 (-) Transcript_23162:356-1933(-)